MITHRDFEDYESYVYKQGGKARGRAEFLLEHLPRNLKRFTEIFTAAKSHLKPGSVLCLGARTGAESLGAAEAGFPGSVGIDLHPVGPTVLKGDWHALEFAPASFDNAYTNSLDHCLFLDRFAAEVKRVLVPGGRFYLMATNRPDSTYDHWVDKGGNEALFWDTSDQLAEAICGYGFTLATSWRSGKWGHYIFTVTA